MKILIGLPTPDTVPVEFALGSLPDIIAYTGKNLKNLDNLAISYVKGVRTDRNRNVILKRAIEDGGFSHILWLDVDMVYPRDIICQYFNVEKGFDIIGCLYFRKHPPYPPVGYIKNNKNPELPFSVLDPKLLESDKAYEVDGLGFGGMMVSMKVYEKMGRKKWMHYGDNYHLPYKTKGRLTHDLQFCQEAQEAGFKIGLHGGVRPAHIATTFITEDVHNSHREARMKEIAKQVKEQKKIEEMANDVEVTIKKKK